MQVFHSAKNKFTTIFLWAMAILIPLPFVFSYNEPFSPVSIVVGILLLSFSSCCVWMLYGCKYILNGDRLYFYCGPLRGKIKIAAIKSVEYDNSFLKTSVYRPALDQNGLVIYYDKFEDIFISPKDIDGFIAALQAINPNIEIK